MKKKNNKKNNKKKSKSNYTLGNSTKENEEKGYFSMLGL